MTRLLTCGYETGDVAEAGTSTIGTNMTLTVVTGTPTPRSGGSYALKVTGSSSSMNITYKTFTLAALKTDVWVRFAVYVHALSTAEVPIAVFLDSGAAGQNCLTYSATDSLLRLRLGNSIGGTLLGTSSSTMSQDGWHLIELRSQITSATAGTSELWLDGTRVINFSGDNTNTAIVGVQSLNLGLLTNPTSQSANNTYLAFDDIAINDTAGSVNNARCGDGRVVMLVPNGAGSNTALTRGGTDSGANWSQVEELPPSMTDYVYSATAATRDTYALGDLSVAPASINCCEVVVLAQNSDAGAGSLGLTVKSGSTTNEGTAQSLSSTAGYIRQLYETDPATSSAWTTSGVNALEAGVTVR